MRCEDDLAVNCVVALGTLVTSVAPYSLFSVASVPVAGTT